MTRFRPALFILLIALALAAAAPALAEKRVALVIGNGAYRTVGALDNPPNDARLMAATLRRLGFEVIERIDAGQKHMKRAVRDFGDKLEAAGKDSVGLFYYAGHGVQVNGRNYMIPVGVEIGDEADVDIEAVPADAVLDQMSFAANRLNIVILDACRNNPFKRGFRSATRGLARMDATKGTLIAYATSPGDVAADGGGLNSPYTAALARTMLTPGLAVERVFKEVRNQVVAATSSKQVPWEASSLTGADFYFHGGTGASPPSAAASAPAPVVVPAPAIDKEALFWESIKDNPSPVDIREFLRKFPNGTFASLARRQLEAMEKPAPTGEATIAALRREAEEKVRAEFQRKEEQEQEQAKLRRLEQTQRSLFDTFLAEGDDAMRRYEKTAALDKFKRALDLYPDSAEAQRRLNTARALIDPCKKFAGDWVWDFGIGSGDMTAAGDGTTLYSDWLTRVPGKWECADRGQRKIVIHWSHGAVDTLRLLNDNEMKGSSSWGLALHALRKGSPEAEARRKAQEAKEESEAEKVH